MHYLRSWWSKEYNRPLKDPLLDSYTLEELVYEYYDKIERRKASELAFEEESDKMEDEQMQDNLDWAAEEERKERELSDKQVETALQKGKEEHGEQFGEDLNVDFS